MVQAPGLRLKEQNQEKVKEKLRYCPSADIRMEKAEIHLARGFQSLIYGGLPQPNQEIHAIPQRKYSVLSAGAKGGASIMSVRIVAN